ncbi:MAG: ketoacyl-ACP synthase III [Clostridia bacterium]|nr:ketoacyl-ACP synthase III [Clostridia bacterium]
MSINIIGTGSYVPEKVLTNDDLSNMVDTSDEWIMQRVGVSERHIAVNESAADMAIKAAEKALENANLAAKDLDLIIASTLTSDTACPTVAGYVQAGVGALCPAFDINSACSGFLFALDTAASFVSRGGFDKILVVGAERVSKIVNWKDRSTCVIFGDGAGAAVVTRGDGYLASKLVTSGGDNVIKIPNYIGTSVFYKKEEDPPYIFMDGQETFKFAVNSIVDDITDVSKKANIALSDIDHVVLHQANIRIMDYASKRLKIPKEKFYANIGNYGNTSSASVAIALDEVARSGKLKRGDIVAMSAFGGGLSSAACILRW